MILSVHHTQLTIPTGEEKAARDFYCGILGLQEIAKPDGCKTRVGIVFDIGGKNDRSFNAAAWEGVKRAKQDLGICLNDVEPGNPTSIEPAMRAFAERNFDLVIGIGFAQGPIMQKVATDFPNVKFAIIDGVIFEADGKTPKKNVASLVFREHGQAGFRSDFNG